MKVFLLSIALAALALAVIEGYVPRTLTEKASDKPEVVAGELRLVSLREFGQGYSIDVDYPQLGLPMDSKIQALVEGEAGSLKDVAQRSSSNSAAQRYTLTGGLTSAYFGSDVVSVRMVLSHYSGSPHGLKLVRAFNFDLGRNRELTLDDVLEMIGMSLQVLSDEALAQIKAKPRFDPQLFSSKGIAPDPKNFETFMVSRDSVTFHFQEYQVGPNVIGLVEVAFPRLLKRK